MPDKGLGAKRCVRKAKPPSLKVPTGYDGGLDLAPAQANELCHRTRPGPLSKRVSEGNKKHQRQARDGDAAILTLADAEGETIECLS